MARLRLGEALEAVGQYTEARKNFEGYLKTLPQGKYAPLAHKALEHMKGKADHPQKTEAPSL
jgi:TolA-binding protein